MRCDGRCGSITDRDGRVREVEQLKQIEDVIADDRQIQRPAAARVIGLVDRRVIAKLEDVTEEIGLPTLMALPEVKPGQNPLNELRSNVVLKQGASVIESYLTQSV